MEQPEPLHPANTKAIAELAEETGTSVLRGTLRYPSESGGWQLGAGDADPQGSTDHDPVAVGLRLGEWSKVYLPMVVRDWQGVDFACSTAQLERKPSAFPYSSRAPLALDKRSGSQTGFQENSLLKPGSICGIIGS
jgi:hypothetical protein